MGKYRIVIKPSAVKELEKIPKKDKLRIIGRIKNLSDNPRPPNCEKLSGKDSYRIRQGNYRIVYLIIERELDIVIIKLGHRKDVYRGNLK